MKVINVGSNDIVIKDIRDNAVVVKPLSIVEVSDKQAQRLVKVYKFNIVEEAKPAEVKQEAKKEEDKKEVKEEDKAKTKINLKKIKEATEKDEEK